MKPCRIPLLLVLATVLAPALALVPDRVASAASGREPAVIASAIPDGAGGMIAALNSTREGGQFSDLYVQKVSAAGGPLWVTLGKVISTTADETRDPVLVSDGAGGVILAWIDLRGPGPGAVYVQRVGSAGTALWTAGGVQISTTVPISTTGAPLEIATDGAGGAILVWRDTRTDDGDVYAQRVNASGVPQWTAGGVGVGVTTGEQRFPGVVSDGAGGAIVAWGDTRAGNADIYAQRLNGSGVPQWTANGVPVCTATGAQTRRRMIPDGSGGAFMVWTDARTGTGDIYAQRVNSSGTPQWTPDGVAACAATGEQTLPHVTADGAGGVVVVWQDKRGGVDYDLYAQRLNGSGVPQWAADGVAVCSTAGDQLGQVITTDGAGGAIVAWYESSGFMRRVLAQRVSSGGIPQWTAGGVTVCPDRWYEQTEPAVVSDGSNGAFMAWMDWGVGEPQLYGQRVGGSGALGWGSGGVCLIADPGVQRAPVSTTDGAGGVILAWMEHQPGQEPDIYARRITSDGTVAWSRVAVCTAAGLQFWPAIASDGAGGAIIAWSDARSGLDMGIYAQRLNAGGVPQWTADGVALASGTGMRFAVTVAPDGAGGAIACWQDLRNGSDFDLYAQRLNAAGAPQWTANGVPICTAAGDQWIQIDQYATRILSDGEGGAYVVWRDGRSGADDIYAQRIGPSGTPLWTVNGEAVCTAPGAQRSPDIALDHPSTPGLFVVWEDGRIGGNQDVYAQRLAQSGAARWFAGGVPIETGASSGYNPRVAGDGLGGAVFAWYDYRSGNGDIYAQRLSPVGTPLWTPNGVTACGASGDQRKPEIIPDAVSGAIIVWEDRRGGTGNEWVDLYGQRLNSQGVPLWPADGVPICGAANTQAAPTIVGDGAGGGIVSWQDRRDGISDYVFSQRINAAGAVLWPGAGVPVSVLPGAPAGALVSLGAVHPNPTRGPMTITLSLPGDEAASLELLDVAGRRVEARSLEGLGRGSHMVTLNFGRVLKPGVYLVRLRQGAGMQSRKVCVLE